VLTRAKSVAKYLRSANNLVSDVREAYVSTGVQAEVAALATPTTPVPDVSPEITKEKYQEFMEVLDEFENFFRNAAVATQDNQSRVNKVFQGG